MTPETPKICDMCKHYRPGIREDDGVPKCPAFPDGIPDEILSEGWDHREPLFDEKILFDPKPGMESRVAQWEELRMLNEEADLERQLLDEPVE